MGSLSHRDSGHIQSQKVEGPELGMAAFGDSRCWYPACVSLGRFAPHLGGRRHLHGTREPHLVQPGPPAAARSASTTRRVYREPRPHPKVKLWGPLAAEQEDLGPVPLPQSVGAVKPLVPKLL